MNKTMVFLWKSGRLGMKCMERWGLGKDGIGGVALIHQLDTNKMIYAVQFDRPRWINAPLPSWLATRTSFWWTHESAQYLNVQPADIQAAENISYLIVRIGSGQSKIKAAGLMRVKTLGLPDGFCGQSKQQMVGGTLQPMSPLFQ